MDTSRHLGRQADDSTHASDHYFVNDQLLQVRLRQFHLLLHLPAK